MIEAFGGLDLPRLILAFVGVLLLLVVLAWSARRLELPKRLGVSTGERIGIVETRWLDSRTRLVIVQRDDRQHLVMLGTNDSLLIESFDRPGPTQASRDK